ncbi:hypothetical protein KKE26_01905 [bacterium]|nr:hypothetical protein [bacterium]MBU1753198.1 hypothetical protein [bacterium]
MKTIALIAALISINAYAEDQTATIDGTGKKVAIHENGTWEALPAQPQHPMAAGMELHENGTWKALPKPEVKLIDQPKDLASAVTVFDTTMVVKKVNYNESVTLAIRYENHTSKRATGLVASIVVKNGFGNVLYATTLQEDVAIEPGAKTSGDMYWHWDDNQFIKGEPYDKMWQAASSNTAKVEVKILKVIFEDGTILKASVPQQIKKKK